MEDAREIRVDHVLPFGVGHLLERPVFDDRRVVHDDVQPPGVSDDLVTHPRDIGHVAHIATHREGSLTESGHGLIGPHAIEAL